MEEGEDDEVDSFVLIEEAKKCYEHGESIPLAAANDPVQCRPFLESLIQALTKREAALGRCSHETAQTYSALASLYFQMDHPRAVVMFRASYRIEFFLYGKCSGHITGDFKHFLVKKGLSENEVKEIRKDVLSSARHEVEGDIMRRFGDRRAAAMEYQKAARIEEVAFGKDNPDLAFLWRKLACLVSIKRVHMHSINFDDCDRPGPKWMKNSSEHLSENICAMIAKGDKYYQALLYSQATREYTKAAMSDRPKQPNKNRRRPHRTSNNPVALEKELRTLIASGSSTAQGQEKSQSQRTNDSTTRIERTKNVPITATKKLSREAPPDEALTDTVGASDAESMISTSDQFSQVEDDLHHVPSIPTSSFSSDRAEMKPDSASEETTLVDNMTKSQHVEHVVVASSVATSDDGSFYSNSQASQFLDSEHTATRVKRKQKPFSATSLYHMVAKTSSRALGAGPQKPKSESTLSRMAIKPASKLATKTMKRLRKRTKMQNPKLQIGRTTENDRSGSQKKAELSYSLLLSPQDTLQESEASKPVSEKEFAIGPIDNDITSAPEVSPVPREMEVIKEDPSVASPLPPKDGFTVLSARSRRRSADRSARSSSRSFSGERAKRVSRSSRTFDREKVTSPMHQQARPNSVRGSKGSLPGTENCNESFIVFEDPTNSSNSPSSADGMPNLL